MKISQIAWMMSAAVLAEAKECEQIHAFPNHAEKDYVGIVGTANVVDKYNFLGTSAGSVLTPLKPNSDGYWCGNYTFIGSDYFIIGIYGYVETMALFPITN